MGLINENLTQHRCCPECNGSLIFKEELGETVCNRCGLVINGIIFDLTFDNGRIYNYQEETLNKKSFNCSYKLVKAPNLKDPISYPVSLIPRYIANLGLNFYVEMLTIKILQSYLAKTCFTGKNPKGLCAAAIYLASKLKSIKISQRQIVEEVGVTEVTLRARYKDILNKINLLSNR